MRPYIKINGISSDTIGGLLITDLPPIRKPEIRYNSEAIDGRDGDIITPLGFSAYDKPIKIALCGSYNIDEVISYFNSDGVITFSNESDKYYRFQILEAIDFERLIRFKTAEVIAHVQPFKYSVSEQELEFVESGVSSEETVINSGNIYSRPIITLIGSGDVTFTLNNQDLLTLELGEEPQTVIIDAENMNAFSPDNQLLNRLITGNYDNIKLRVGSNVIETIGAITKIKVKNYSRWI